MTGLEVAVAAPLAQTLTYLPPDDAGPALQPGLRLLVPLGRRQVTGYLLAPAELTAEHRLRRVTTILDSEPLFPASLVPFFRWLARYYHHPIGEVIRTALPAGLAPRSGWQLRLTAAGRAAPAELAAAVGGERPWLAPLLAKGELSMAATARLRAGNERRLLTRLEAAGLVTLREALAGDGVRVRTEPWLRLARPEAGFPAGAGPAAARLLALFAELAGLDPGQAVARRALVAGLPRAGRTLKALVEEGILAVEEREAYRDPFGDALPVPARPQTLSPEQEAALAALLPAVATRRFAPFLLHGVTGAGKTEVYLRAAAATLQEGRSVLVLVPEIALAAQLEGQFLSRFGNRVALLHSGLGSGERYDQWRRLLRGQATVAIGARSALFAPLADPGLIIVDEEHDGAYKQEDGLRYQARDLAVLRAQLAGAVVLLGSATPSVTSFQHALADKYRLLTMERRVQDRPLPTVRLVDLKAVPTVSGRPPLFAPDLVQAMRDNLAAGNQTLLFLNRRGYAGLVLCTDCGTPVGCPHCQISLTLHKKRGQLACHWCGFVTAHAALCASCQGANLVPVGFGTERLEEEIGRLLPRARLGRLDRDTAASRRQLLALLRAVHDREIDILVGTQMIAKGHHFPHVTLVGIVWADAGLGFPDFRAAERTFQLLSQVMGRAGRADKPGQVIVQTHQPGHYSIRAALEHDYRAFFRQELALRRQVGYPPFCRLVSLRLEGEDEAQVQETTTELAKRARRLARGLAGLTVLGPAPAPLVRLKDRFRWQILLKGRQIDDLHRLVTALELERLAGLGTAVQMHVDVDPESMV
ncbi:MAG: primosomal protein N' [Thermodesulfobacteriota bacterium]